MTATPIPRSLALTLYGDMDVSVLDELPPGRQPITTKIYYEKKRDDAYEFLRAELDKGRQAYVVCPLIEESAMLDLNTAIAVQEYLTQLFSDRQVGLIHDQLKKEDRQSHKGGCRDG
jgi:ATP-dependent DNA helicase RecG